MDIALALVRLHHKQVGHMAADVVFVAGRIAAEDFLETRKDMSVGDPQHRLRMYIHSRAGQRAVTVLALNHGDHLGSGLARVL